jgi:uncharacterized membrane protein YfcA
MGFPGLAMVNVVIMADLFGAKQSVGIILPLLVLCDLVIFPIYRKHATWAQIWPLLFPSLVGIVLGWLLLDAISNLQARRSLGFIILFMATLQLLRQYRTGLLTHLPSTRGFRWGSGVTIGFATMLANAAGPAYAIYALVMKLSKSAFLGIGARLFLLLNLIKVPFNVELGILHRQSLQLDAALAPAILLGILVGRQAITRIPEKVFQALLYLFSFVAGGRLLFF